jgi:hypothetical protein
MDSGGVWALIILGGIIWISLAALVRAARKKRLIAKYGDSDLTRLIIAKKICQGMTSEQLIDSWGNPVETDQKILKTKTNETWKYGRTGKNRFKNRVFLENGVVVGWQSH